MLLSQEEQLDCLFQKFDDALAFKCLHFSHHYYIDIDWNLVNRMADIDAHSWGCADFTSSSTFTAIHAAVALIPSILVTFSPLTLVVPLHDLPYV